QTIRIDKRIIKMADRESAKEKDNKSLMYSIKIILGKEDKLNDQLEKEQGLESYAKDLLFLLSLFKDYDQANYRNLPYKTSSAAVVGLLYVINPIDIIPDFIPFIGHIDDVLVLRFCLKLVEKDLAKYKSWKNEQTASKDTTSKPSDKKLEDKSKSLKKTDK